MKYIASCSFGKDSLAMVLKLLEKEKYPLDEVVFCDTGMEFKAIYNNRDKLVEILANKGVKYTELSFNKPFEYYAFDHNIKTKDRSKKVGYGWCGGCARWGTTLKKQAINNYYKTINEPIVEYIGIATDEQKRLDHLGKTVKIYPLAEWGMTEKGCLEYCYSKGFNWLEDGIELYQILDRVSCWCCLNKNLKELENIMEYLPSYWQKLKDYEARCGKPCRQGIDHFEQRSKKACRQISLEV